MSYKIILGILLPFIGTTIGSAAVFLTRKRTLEKQNASLSGFAAGVMVAASVWSLIIPAVEMSQNLGYFAFFPMLIGFWLGIVFLIVSEDIISHIPKMKGAGKLLFFLAVVLHNIPEGMAVGVAFALAISSGSVPFLLSAFMLSVGMTLQNIPEGAIISLPLADGGKSKAKSFVLGSLSGIVEPLAAFAAIAFSSAAASLLPYLLGFAAGAMIFVSVKELIPEAEGLGGVLWFCTGFSVMMVLDIALG